MGAGEKSHTAKKKSNTPLIAASSEGHKEVVDALFDSKELNINAVDKDGTTSLMAAAVRGHKEIATALIGKGPMSTHRTQTGTPRSCLRTTGATKSRRCLTSTRTSSSQATTTTTRRSSRMLCRRT